MAEIYYADFSGGLNTSPPEDLLPPNECLRAENVVFDEIGSVGIGGTRVRENSVALTDGAGNAAEIHSFILSSIINLFAAGDVLYAGSLASPTALSGFFASAVRSPTLGESTGTGIVAWTNPENIVTSNDVRATASLTLNDTTKKLRATGFNFNIPSNAVILGVLASVEGQRDASVNLGSTGFSLVNEGLVLGSKSIDPDEFDVGSDSFLTAGGSSDLWASTLTPAIINSGTFGFQYSTKATGTVQVSIDHMTLTVYYRDAGLNLSTTRRISWTDWNTLIFFESGGTPFLVKSTGSVQALDFQEPASAPSPVISGTGSLNGTYTYKVTFGTADGDESNAGPESSSVAPATQGVDVRSIPQSSDTKVTKRFIYRKGGNLPVYYQVGEINNTLETAFHDAKSDEAVLTDAILLSETNNPITNQTSSVRYPEMYFDRLFWVDYSAGANRIIWSKPLNPLSYPTANLIDVGTGGAGGRIVGLVNWLDSLVILKEDSIWRLTGNSEENFELQRTISSVGCQFPYTISSTKDRIIFLNLNGLWYFDGLTSRPFTNRLEPFFSGFTKAGNTPINTANRDFPQASVLGDRYYLLYIDTSTNIRIMTFDITGGNISLLTHNAGSIAVDSQDSDIYMGGVDGFIYRMDEGTDLTEGLTSTFTYQTKFFDQLPGMNKHFQAVGIDIDTDGLSITPTVLYDNGEASETITAITTTDRDRVIRRLDSARARKARNISLQLSGTYTRTKKSSGSLPSIRLFQFGVYFEPLPQRVKVA